MEPDEKEMLKKTLELTRENNNMLHGIRRGMFWGGVWKIIYWIVIIGASIGVYYYIQPYVDSIVNTYGSIKGGIQNIQNIGNTIKPN